MDKARFLIETHLRTGRPLAELAAAHGVHRSWLYKLLARYRQRRRRRAQPRSGRPHHSPTAIRARSKTTSSPSARNSPTSGSTPAPPPSRTTSPAAAPTPLGLDDLAGPQARGLRHPPTPETPEQLLPPLRGRVPQRMLAGRHDPLDPRRRPDRRDPQHHRRPLPAVRRLPVFATVRSPDVVAHPAPSR